MDYQNYLLLDFLFSYVYIYPIITRKKDHNQKNIHLYTYNNRRHNSINLSDGILKYNINKRIKRKKECCLNDPKQVRNWDPSHIYVVYVCNEKCIITIMIHQHQPMLHTIFTNHFYCFIYIYCNIATSSSGTPLFCLTLYKLSTEVFLIS